MPDKTIHILLIEDNPGDARLVQELLQDVSTATFQVDHAPQLAKGVERLNQGGVDLILLDLSLPDSLGLYTLVKVQRSAADVPIIVLTGLADETLAEQAVQAGAQDYLVKGQVDASLLGRSIRYAIERQRNLGLLRLYSKVFTSTSEAIVITDTHARIILVNPAFTALTGYSTEQVAGHRPDVFLPTSQQPEVHQEMWRTLRETGQWQGEIWSSRKNGESYPARVSIDAVRNNSGEVLNYVSLFRDITLEKRAEEELRALSLTDELTGLYNRRGFMTLAEHHWKLAYRTRHQFLIVYLDQDNLKQVNDTCGHTVGDAALCAIAQLLRQTFRDSDILARLGGDEFVALVNDGIGDSAEMISARLQAQLGGLRLENNRVPINLSFGIACFDPHQPRSLQEVMAEADQAMYKVKAAKKSARTLLDNA